MVKEKLFKFLFPKFYKQYIDRKDRIDILGEMVQTETRRNEGLQLRVRRSDEKPTFDKMFAAILMELGLPNGLDFADVDEDGKPPHYMHGLSDEGRKNYIARLESIYSDTHFNDVLKYVINVIGNHSIQKAPEDKMKNGKIGIIGIRTLLSEFAKAHDEYLQSRKDDVTFDPLATMPE